MFQNCKKYWLFFSAFLLLVADIFIFYLAWQNYHRDFTFAMLDIGQGDTLFIESPTGTQILIDSGPPRKILNQLSQIMSPFDRKIDAFIITNPDQDVSFWSTNDGSIVAKLFYGNTSIMLTGDATIKTEKIILEENSIAQLNSDILKVGHHGSRTSTSPEFVKAISPTYAFISDGKDNKYGHPHQETLDVDDHT